MLDVPCAFEGHDGHGNHGCRGSGVERDDAMHRGTVMRCIEKSER